MQSKILRLLQTDFTLRNEIFERFSEPGQSANDIIDTLDNNMLRLYDNEVKAGLQALEDSHRDELATQLEELDALSYFDFAGFLHDFNLNHGSDFGYYLRCSNGMYLHISW